MTKKCTKRNPNPPCNIGFYEKKNPKGIICCYKKKSQKQKRNKSPKKKISKKIDLNHKKKKQIKRRAKRRKQTMKIKDLLKKFDILPGNQLPQKTSRLIAYRKALKILRKLDPNTTISNGKDLIQYKGIGPYFSTLVDAIMNSKRIVISKKTSPKVPISIKNKDWFKKFNELLDKKSSIFLDTLNYVQEVHDDLWDDISSSDPKIKKLNKTLFDAMLKKKDLTSMILSEGTLQVLRPQSYTDISALSKNSNMFSNVSFPKSLTKKTITNYHYGYFQVDKEENSGVSSGSDDVWYKVTKPLYIALNNRYIEMTENEEKTLEYVKNNRQRLINDLIAKYVASINSKTDNELKYLIDGL